jgi:hypothetical protein
MDSRSSAREACYSASRHQCLVFDANSVLITHEGNRLQVTFADEAINPRNQFVLHRACKTDPHAADPAEDSVRAKLSQQERSAVGGIQHLVLKRHAVRVTVDQNIATGTGGEYDLTVRFRLERHRLRELRTALKQLCKGQRCFVDDSATGLALLKAIVIGPPTPTSERLVGPTYGALVGTACGGCLGYQKSGISGAILGALGGLLLGTFVGLLKGFQFWHLFRYK